MSLISEVVNYVYYHLVDSMDVGLNFFELLLNGEDLVYNYLFNVY